MSVCKSVQLEMHRPENTNKFTDVLKIRISSQMYGHLHVLHFILYLTFTASLYDGKYACFIWEW